ncbi:hypothetical protein GEMRC1_007871 [Eukaryota sp. GEM-RC1]
MTLGVQQLFSASGSAPLANLDSSKVRRVFDSTAKGYIFSLDKSSNSSLTYPKAKKPVTLPERFLAFIISVCDTAPFSLELMLTDVSGAKRRIIMSTVVSKPSFTPLHCRLPFPGDLAHSPDRSISVKEILNSSSYFTLFLDLENLCESSFSQSFAHLSSISLRSTCRLRCCYSLRFAPQIPNSPSSWPSSPSFPNDLSHLPFVIFSTHNFDPVSPDISIDLPQHSYRTRTHPIQQQDKPRVCSTPLGNHQQKCKSPDLKSQPSQSNIHIAFGTRIEAVERKDLVVEKKVSRQKTGQIQGERRAQSGKVSSNTVRNPATFDRRAQSGKVQSISSKNQSNVDTRAQPRKVQSNFERAPSVDYQSNVTSSMESVSKSPEPITITADVSRYQSDTNVSIDDAPDDLQSSVSLSFGSSSISDLDDWCNDQENISLLELSSRFYASGVNQVPGMIHPVAEKVIEEEESESEGGEVQSVSEEESSHQDDVSEESVDESDQGVEEEESESEEEESVEEVQEKEEEELSSERVESDVEGDGHDASLKELIELNQEERDLLENSLKAGQRSPSPDALHIEEEQEINQSQEEVSQSQGSHVTNDDEFVVHTFEPQSPKPFSPPLPTQLSPKPQSRFDF